MIAHVVPITRLRRATTVWSYRIGNHAVQAGSLVTIPFRGRQTLGLVWEITEKDTDATESVSSVLCATPLLRPRDRQFVEYLAEAGLLSFSTALYIYLPAALRKLPLTAPVRTLLTEHTTWQPTAAIMANRKQQLVVLPSARPTSTTKIAAKYPGKLWDTFIPLGATAELREWLAAARGERTIITGRERALFTPFLNLQHLVVREAEDVAFFHEQLPYISLVEAAAALAATHGIQPQIQSYLPSQTATLLFGPDSLGSPASTVPALIDLKIEPVLNPGLIGQIKATLAAKKLVILLYNAHDRQFLDKETSQTILLPGIETLRKKLAITLGLPALPPSIHLGTRALFAQTPERVGFTAILSLDPLLRTSIFADYIQGLADISRLLSYPAPCQIQAHLHDHPLLLALQNQQFSKYSLETVTARSTAQLPPFATSYVCSLPAGSQDEAGRIASAITPLIQVPWQISSILPLQRRKEQRVGFFLHAPLHTRLNPAVRTQLCKLVRPWKVERNPWFVL